MPVDQSRPKDAGNVVFTGNSRGGDGTPEVRVVSPGEGTHVPHFATCPHATQHRKGI